MLSGKKSHLQKEENLSFLILKSVQQRVKLTSQICRVYLRALILEAQLDGIENPDIRNDEITCYHRMQAQLSQFVRNGWLIQKEIGAHSLTELGTQQLTVVTLDIPKHLSTLYCKALNEISNEITNEIKTTQPVDLSEWSKKLFTIQHPPEKLRIAEALKLADIRGFIIFFDEEKNKWTVSVPQELVEVARKALSKNVSDREVMIVSRVGTYEDLLSF